VFDKMNERRNIVFFIFLKLNYNYFFVMLLKW